MNKMDMIKQILYSFLYGLIISILLIITKVYYADKMVNSETRLSLEYIIKVTQIFFEHIFTVFKLYFFIPVFLIIPILQLIILHRIVVSKQHFFAKYRTIILTIFFSSSYLLTYNMLNFFVV